MTTCSPRNFDVSLPTIFLFACSRLTCSQFVKSLGAEAAFDYNDPDCGSKIRELTKDSLKLVFDCISEGRSPEIDCAAISTGGKITYLLPAEHSRKDVENTVSSFRA